MERKDIERAKEIYEQISVLEEELKEMYGSHNRN